MESTSPTSGRRRRALTVTLQVAGSIVAVGALIVGGLALAEWARDARDERAAAQTEGPCDPSDDPTDTRSTCLYPDRDDQQPEDHEAAVGDSVRIAGYTATLDDAFMNELVLEDQLTLQVTVHNRESKPQPFGPLDWKIEDITGALVNPSVNEREDALVAGELDPDERITGTITYDLPAGTYFVIFRPDLFNQGRGIYRVTLDPL